MSKRTVVYAGTDNLLPIMRVALTSLLVNNAIDRVYLLIERDSFPYGLPGNVRVINVSKQQYFPENGVNYNSRWSYMTLIRTALTKILPDEKRVLWLDCDTIVNADITELFEVDMGGNYFAAVREPGRSINGKNYFNAGVLLMNLDKIKADGLDDRLIDTLNHKPFVFPDQDAINQLAEGRIMALDGRYNVSRFTEPSDVKKIYHFAGFGSHVFDPLFIKYKNMGVT